MMGVTLGFPWKTGRMMDVTLEFPTLEFPEQEDAIRGGAAAQGRSREQQRGIRRECFGPCAGVIPFELGYELGVRATGRRAEIGEERLAVD
jgi:hypothetical protein